MKLWTLDKQMRPSDEATTLAELSSCKFYLGEARRPLVAKHNGRNVYLDGLMHGYAFTSEDDRQAFLIERKEQSK